MIDANHADLANWGQATSWQASSLPGGTPGTAETSRLVGDVNGDHQFDSSDLVIVFQAGE
ncbi:MAG: hypothetical protein GY768_20145 [Planctomycetaceae bacterium]|nr:hypothetical protein [Planctomycetaceae bacterium]